MQFKVSIESENGIINITDLGVICKVSLQISQSDKSANDRSDKLFGTLSIQGKIDSSSNQQTKDIFDWSKKTDEANIYKKVSIQVFKGESLLKEYYFKDMFCTSYEESYVDSDENETGIFKLEMKQKYGSIQNIKVD